MTTIKYSAVYQRRSSGNTLLARGKGEKTEQLFDETEDGVELVTINRVDVIDLPEPMSPSEWEDWADEHSVEILGNYQPMTESATELNLLQVSADRAGEDITVRSLRPESEGEEIESYVDDDGTVRQKSNGAAFNADVYELVD